MSARLQAVISGQPWPVLRSLVGDSRGRQNDALVLRHDQQPATAVDRRTCPKCRMTGEVLCVGWCCGCLLPRRYSTAHRVPCPTPHSKRTGPLIAQEPRPLSWTHAGGPQLEVAPEVKGLQHSGPRGADGLRHLLAATAFSRVGLLSVSGIRLPSREKR